MDVKVKIGCNVICDSAAKEEEKKNFNKSLLRNVERISQENLHSLKTNFREDFPKEENSEKTRNSSLTEYKNFWNFNSLFGDETHLFSHFSDHVDTMIFPYGLAKGELYTISGISGGGKTAFCTMLTCCLISGNNPFLNASKVYKPTPVIYISLEQTKLQMEARFISTISALNDLSTATSYASLLSGVGLKQKKSIDVALDLFWVYKKNLFIISLEDFEETPSVDELKRVILNLIQVNEIDNPVVIVDRYENIIDADSQQNDYVARELKRFAGKCQLPIIVQAQLNKSSISSAKQNDGSFDHKKLSGNSLRGTSGLEHNSTNIIILVPEDRNKVVDGDEFKLVRIVNAKGRYNAQCDCLCWFIGAYNLFLDHVETRGRKSKENNE